MEERYSIDAAHPVLKRVIKFNLSKEEFDNWMKELKEYGYEDIIVKKG